MNYTYNNLLQSACIQLTCNYSEFLLLCAPEEHKNMKHDDVYQAFYMGRPDNIIAQAMTIELTAQTDSIRRLARSFLNSIQSFLQLWDAIKTTGAGNLPVY